MKILILGTAYPWRGGIAHYIALLAQHLQHSQHSVDVVTFTRQYPKLLFPGKSQEESGHPGIIINTEQLIDSINPLNWLNVGFKLRRRHYDVVVFKYWLPFFAPCFGTICRILKYKKQTTIIALCDNVIPHERRIGDHLQTRYAFSTVDGFLVQSNTVEKDLLKLFPDAKYRRVEHPIYEIFGDEISKQDARKKLNIRHQKVLLFFGYIRRYKGLDILLEAMHYLQDDPQLLLLVVGEFYDDEEYYLKKAAKLGIGTSVQFISGYLPNEQVAPYFCAADCVVLPYRSATQSGIVQIAYNFNKPVIATNVGGLSEIVRNNVTGFIVEPENPLELAKAIRLFYSGDYETAFINNIQKEKHRYSWKALVDIFNEFVNELKKQ